MHDMETASPNAKIIVIKTIGIAHNISKPTGSPRTERNIAKITSVGMNRKIATTVADTGNMILGKAVFKMRRCPAVIDFTPPLRVLEIK